MAHSSIAASCSWSWCIDAWLHGNIVANSTITKMGFNSFIAIHRPENKQKVQENRPEAPGRH